MPPSVQSIKTPDCPPADSHQSSLAPLQRVSKALWAEYTDPRRQQQLQQQGRPRSVHLGTAAHIVESKYATWSQSGIHVHEHSVAVEAHQAPAVATAAAQAAFPAMKQPRRHLGHSWRCCLEAQLILKTIGTAMFSDAFDGYDAHTLWDDSEQQLSLAGAAGTRLLAALDASAGAGAALACCTQLDSCPSFCTWSSASG